MKTNYFLKPFILSVLLFSAAVCFRASAQCSVTASNDTTLTTGFGPQNCVVLNATASGTSPFTYSWDNGATIANPLVCPTTTTTYIVTVTDSTGCTATDIVTVFVTDVSCGRRKVSICHIPPGDPGAAHTLCISENAVAGHLRHGDMLGECPVTPPT